MPSILLVDDSGLFRGAAEEVLKRTGCQTLTASGGTEALDIARFDLIELVECFVEARRDFVGRSYVRAEEINIGADFYLKAALREAALQC